VLKRLTATALAAALVLATGPSPAAQVPSVEELVTAATAYVKSYTQQVSGVTLDELLVLTEIGLTTQGTIAQRVASDLILLNVAGEMLGMRDVYAVDTKPLRPKEPRIPQLLVERTPNGNWPNSTHGSMRCICEPTSCCGSAIRCSCCGC
jgi:hypothetical protein